MTALPRATGGGPARLVAPGRRGVRIGPFSGVLRPRSLAVGVLAAAGLAVVLVAAVGIGDVPLPPQRVVPALIGLGDPAATFVVQELRLPRVLTGLLVGAALAVAGALTQTVARNPLASPDVLGVTAGASTAAVAVILLGGTTAGAFQPANAALASIGVPGAALIGGIVTAALVLLLAHRQGVEGFRLVLVGIGVGAVAEAVTSWLLVRARIDQAGIAAQWLTGSLGNRGWEQALPVAGALAVLLPLALLLGFSLDVLQLGDDTATALGARAVRTTVLAVGVAVVLTAVAVAAAGPVEFVALVAPQIAVRLVRGSRPPIVVSALFGALLVAACDLAGRALLPVDLPVGVVTAVVGAPYLLVLLVGRNRRVTA